MPQQPSSAIRDFFEKQGKSIAVDPSKWVFISRNDPAFEIFESEIDEELWKYLDQKSENSENPAVRTFKAIAYQILSENKKDNEALPDLIEGLARLLNMTASSTQENIEAVSAYVRYIELKIPTIKVRERKWWMELLGVMLMAAGLAVMVALSFTGVGIVGAAIMAAGFFSGLYSYFRKVDQTLKWEKLKTEVENISPKAVESVEQKHAPGPAVDLNPPPPLAEAKEQPVDSETELDTSEDEDAFEVSQQELEELNAHLKMQYASSNDDAQNEEKKLELSMSSPSSDSTVSHHMSSPSESSELASKAPSPKAPELETPPLSRDGSAAEFGERKGDGSVLDKILDLERDDLQIVAHALHIPKEKVSEIRAELANIQEKEIKSAEALSKRKAEEIAQQEQKAKAKGQASLEKEVQLLRRQVGLAQSALHEATKEKEAAQQAVNAAEDPYVRPGYWFQPNQLSGWSPNELLQQKQKILDETNEMVKMTQKRLDFSEKYLAMWKERVTQNQSAAEVLAVVNAQKEKDDFQTEPPAWREWLAALMPAGEDIVKKVNISGALSVGSDTAQAVKSAKKLKKDARPLKSAATDQLLSPRATPIFPKTKKERKQAAAEKAKKQKEEQQRKKDNPNAAEPPKKTDLRVPFWKLAKALGNAVSDSVWAPLNAIERVSHDSAKEEASKKKTFDAVEKMSEDANQVVTHTAKALVSGSELLNIDPEKTLFIKSKTAGGLGIVDAVKRAFVDYVLPGLSAANSVSAVIEGGTAAVSSGMGMRRWNAWASHSKVSLKQPENALGGFDVLSGAQKIAGLWNMQAVLQEAFQSELPLFQSVQKLKAFIKDSGHEGRAYVETLMNRVIELIPKSEPWPSDDFSTRLAIYKQLMAEAPINLSEDELEDESESEDDEASSTPLMEKMKMAAWDIFYQKAMTFSVDKAGMGVSILAEVMGGVGFDQLVGVDAVHIGQFVERFLPEFLPIGGPWFRYCSDMLTAQLLRATSAEAVRYITTRVVTGIMRKNLEDQKEDFLKQFHSKTTTVLRGFLFNPDELKMVEYLTDSMPEELENDAPEVAQVAEKLSPIQATLLLKAATTTLPGEPNPPDVMKKLADKTNHSVIELGAKAAVFLINKLGSVLIKDSPPPQEKPVSWDQYFEDFSGAHPFVASAAAIAANVAPAIPVGCTFAYNAVTGLGDWLTSPAIPGEAVLPPPLAPALIPDERGWNQKLSDLGGAAYTAVGQGALSTLQNHPAITTAVMAGGVYYISPKWVKDNVHYAVNKHTGVVVGIAGIGFSWLAKDPIAAVGFAASTVNAAFGGKPGRVTVDAAKATLRTGAWVAGGVVKAPGKIFGRFFKGGTTSVSDKSLPAPVQPKKP